MLFPARPPAVSSDQLAERTLIEGFLLPSAKNVFTETPIAARSLASSRHTEGFWNIFSDGKPQLIPASLP